MDPRILGLAASLLYLVGTTAPAQTLRVGDDAPPLAVSRWIKGEKIERLEPDRTYVVEFWATWCGPCRASIPHLTEIQGRYQAKGVRVIGVSVWEQDPAEVAPFVEAMGAKMAYAVALDDVPENSRGHAGKMAVGWMDASGADGIPTAFIVHGGKVAWIGHPVRIDKTLEQITAGGFDLARAAADYRQEKADEQALMKAHAQLKQLEAGGTDRERLGVIDATIDANPRLEKALGIQKYLLMIRLGEVAAPTYGAKLVDGDFRDEAEELNLFAWSIMAPEDNPDRARRDFPLALRAATRADELAHHENGSILDTLALAQFETGDAAKALATQERAVKLMTEEDGAMKGRLEQYRKAVAERGGKP